MLKWIVLAIQVVADITADVKCRAAQFLVAGKHLRRASIGTLIQLVIIGIMEVPIAQIITRIVINGVPGVPMEAIVG
jgi:hypothetical protein